MFAQALAYAVMGLALVVTGLVFLAEVPSHRPNPCEAGRVGAAGVAVAFLCAGIALARPALHDVTAAVRGRRAGNVALIGSSLVLDLPGCCGNPVRRPRVDRGGTSRGGGGSKRRAARRRWWHSRREVLDHEAVRLPRAQVHGSARPGRLRTPVFPRFAPVQPSPWAPIGIVAVEPARVPRVTASHRSISMSQSTCLPQAPRSLLQPARWRRCYRAQRTCCYTGDPGVPGHGHPTTARSVGGGVTGPWQLS